MRTDGHVLISMEAKQIGVPRGTISKIIYKRYEILESKLNISSPYRKCYVSIKKRSRKILTAIVLSWNVTKPKITKIDSAGWNNKTKFKKRRQ